MSDYKDRQKSKAYFITPTGEKVQLKVNERGEFIEGSSDAARRILYSEPKLLEEYAVYRQKIQNAANNVMRADYCRNNSLVEYGFLLLKGYISVIENILPTAVYCPDAISKERLNDIKFMRKKSIIDYVRKERDYNVYMETSTMDKIQSAAYKAIDFMYQEMFEKGKNEGTHQEDRNSDDGER